jgi:hypothetical protein
LRFYIKESVSVVWANREAGFGETPNTYRPVANAPAPREGDVFFFPGPHANRGFTVVSFLIRGEGKVVYVVEAFAQVPQNKLRVRAF